MYLLLFAFWILLNGKITKEILLFGLVIAAAIFWFVCKFMDHSIRKEMMLYKSIGQFILYFLILLREIFIANINVLKLVYSPKYVPEPGLVYFKTDLKTGLAKVMLANSITLTPGTITVSLKDDEFCVHCLDMAYAEDIEKSVFVQQLKKMEEGWKA